MCTQIANISLSAINRLFSFQWRLSSFLYDKGNDKVFSVHAMKTYKKATGITPLILNLGTDADEWLTYAPPAILPREWVGSTAGLDVLWGREKYLTPTGTRTPDPPACKPVAIPTALPPLPRVLFRINMNFKYYAVIFQASDGCKIILRTSLRKYSVISNCHYPKRSR
jgi:hypothetical protein